MTSTTASKADKKRAHPNCEAGREIWSVMAERFARELEAGLIETLADSFPPATVAGFWGCAIFRGVNLGAGNPLSDRTLAVRFPTYVAKATAEIEKEQVNSIS